MALPTTTLTPPSDTNDYSKIFSTNESSTPFTWLDADYLKGWDIVGSVPPARTQFNALQRMTDEKLKALKAYTEFQKQYNAYLKSCSEYLDNVKAPINSPTFTGDPKAPTPPQNDNDTSIATTEFVQTWVADLTSRINAVQATADAAQRAARDAQNTANSAGSSAGMAAADLTINSPLTFRGFQAAQASPGNWFGYALFEITWSCGNDVTRVDSSGGAFWSGTQAPRSGTSDISVQIGIGSNWQADAALNTTRTLTFTAFANGKIPKTVQVAAPVPDYRDSLWIGNYPDGVIPNVSSVSIV